MKYGHVDFDTYFDNYPDHNGYFGKYGGCYISPELQEAMQEINEAYQTLRTSECFINELMHIRKEFQGRPTPITYLRRLSKALGTDVKLYAKREDLNHTGAHKLNHCMGEALLAKYMGKKKVIAETGPEHAFLHDIGRVKYDVIGDEETVDAFYTMSRLEGIIPAIESAHAAAYAMKLAKKMETGTILINLSGRGDKDLEYMIEKYGIPTV